MLLIYHLQISTLFLFSLHEVFKDCQESWKAIVIDEFQDTSAMQYGLLLILASHKRITVIGDEDQVCSISKYAFSRNLGNPILSSFNLSLTFEFTVIYCTQSIFSFNGADVSGFDSFRKDFPVHKEVCLFSNSQIC